TLDGSDDPSDASDGSPDALPGLFLYTRTRNLYGRGLRASGKPSFPQAGASPKPGKAPQERGRALTAVSRRAVHIPARKVYIPWTPGKPPGPSIHIFFRQSHIRPRPPEAARQ